MLTLAITGRRWACLLWPSERFFSLAIGLSIGAIVAVHDPGNAAVVLMAIAASFTAAYRGQDSMNDGGGAALTAKLVRETLAAPRHGSGQTQQVG